MRPDGVGEKLEHAALDLSRAAWATTQRQKVAYIEAALDCLLSAVVAIEQREGAVNAAR